VGALALASAAWSITLSFARWSSLANHTFDLAFYARLAWGLVHGHTWEPIVGAHVFGLHLSPILVPLGALGIVFGTVPVLLVAQALAVGLAAFPLARLGARRAGDLGALAAATALVVQPNLGPALAEAFHPGTVAVLPIAWAIDAVDRRDARALGWSVVGILSCREDLALVAIVLGLLFEDRRVGRKVALAAAAWLAIWLAVLLPIFGPHGGSFHLHFGSLFAAPGAFLAHLFTAERLLYVPKVLLPFALLPILGRRWLWVAAPILAVNFLSAFPTTVDLASHYLTPALPALACAALDGAVAVGKRLALPALAVAALVAYAIAGRVPLDHADARTAAARRVLAAIPPEASVQAPAWMLAHVAERDLLFRGPPPDREAAWVVLDLSYRHRHEHTETLLRTREEPIVRHWLARDDHAIRRISGDLVLLERGASPRDGLGARAIRGQGPTEIGTPLSDCLSLVGGRRAPGRVDLDLVARGSCPADIGLRIGVGPKPRRVDLLFDGIFSPVHLRPGDRVRSSHVLSPVEEDALTRGALRVGLLRSGGARIERTDPMSVPVALE